MGVDILLANTLLRNTISEIREIRNHKLTLLLRFSGEKVNIENNYSAAWEFVKDWDPEMRYSNSIVRKQKAINFLKNSRIIISNII